jgi:FkbM family methyltransferase
MVRTPMGFRLIGHEQMQAGSFEPKETRLVTRLLEKAEVFVDVGANIGYYTALACHAGKTVLCVEPLAENLEFLYRNLRENGWEGVEVFPVGVSSRPGVMTLYGAGTGASLIAGWAGSSELLRRDVALSTLDILLGERFAGRTLLIKVDVEGAERDVLLGAERTLDARPAPIWLMEVHWRFHDGKTNEDFPAVFELFRSAGYYAWAIDGSELFTAEQVEQWMRTRADDYVECVYLFSRDALAGEVLS